MHLLGIWYPPIEAAHSWRQATGLMVARNYFQGNTSFFFPMVDETNGGSGIIGMEFPLLYYLHGKLSLWFGFHPGLGRAITLVISCLGLFYFYALIRRFVSEKHAFFSTILFMISCFFMYSRKVMPDTAALAVYIIGMFYFFEAFCRGEKRDIFLSFLFLSLGLLLKISVLPLWSFLVFAYLYYRNKPKKAWVMLIPVLSLIPAFLWYFVWNPYLEGTYGNWYNLGGSWTNGASVLLHQPLTLLHHLVFHPLFGFFGFCAGMYGIYRAWNHGVDRSVWISLVVFLVLFAAYALKSGAIFISHDYYILPLVPVLSLLAGWGIASTGKYAWLVMAIIASESLGNQWHDLSWNENEAYKLSLKTLADQHIPSKALVAINGNSNPQELFFLNRKGWNVSNDQCQQEPYMKAIKAKGCRFLVCNTRSVPCPTFLGKIVAEDENYCLLELK